MDIEIVQFTGCPVTPQHLARKVEEREARVAVLHRAHGHPIAPRHASGSTRDYAGLRHDVRPIRRLAAAAAVTSTL